LQPVRILVVDDFEPFRRFVCSTLGTRAEFQLVAEASDGQDAILKAQEHQPDLIVLDISLPTLNGIEAARQIRKLSPNSKILFLSQYAILEVVQEAFRLGAFGYLVKAHAGSELLVAVDTVRQGQQYLGTGLPARESIATINGSKQPSIPASDDCMHLVQFHSDDESLLAGFSTFAESKLKTGNAVIAALSRSHLDSLFARLKACGPEIASALAQGRFFPLDVADLLASFMVKGSFDPDRFRKVVGDVVVAAAKTVQGDCSRVASCGEVAPTLLAEGKLEAAIQLEHLWHEMAKAGNIDTLCGYLMNPDQHDREREIYDRICAEHSAVLRS